MSIMLSGTFYQPFLSQILQNKRTPRVKDSDGFSRTFFYPGGIYAMIGFCNHKNGSRTLPDQSSVSASFHHMEAGAAIPPCSLLMITVPYSQIPLSIHVSVARCCENGEPLCSVLRRQTHLDENHISSLARSYRRHWRDRLRAVPACAASLRDLVRGCFAVFSRQFMQIKTTRNKLFLLPT